MYCQKCGNNLAEGSQFCTRCGQEIGAVAPQISAAVPQGEMKLPASNWKRLANSFIDGIVLFVLYYIAGRYLSQPPASLSVLVFFIKYLLFFAYYLLFEGIFGRTIGKFITKTKVVDENGERPYFGKIIIRSFARLIPFEALSFLTGSHASGWHDTLAHTLVVPVSYAKEDVQIIVGQGIKSQGKKWWIAVLVLVLVLPVIAIIGFISILSYGSAGYMQLLQKNLLQLQSNSISYFNEGKDNNYAGFCSQPESQKLIKELDNGNDCNDSASAWAFSVQPTHGSFASYWCVDSVRTGIAKTATPLGSATVCPSE